MSVNKRGKPNKKQHLKGPFDRDDENRIIVNMTVKDDSEFLSVFLQAAPLASVPKSQILSRISPVPSPFEGTDFADSQQLH